MTRIPTWLSVLALVVTTVVGVAYLSFGVLGARPLAARTHLIVDLTDTAGLRVGSDVVYRGVDIGEVTGVSARPGGVRLDLHYDSVHRVPTDSVLKVEQLSALGEPVFAFLPQGTTDDAFVDGAHLTEGVEVPTSVPELLTRTSTLLAQLDPDRITRLVDAFTGAVAGLDTTVTPAIRRAADLLLTTILGRRGSLETLVETGSTILSQSDVLHEPLLAAPPQLDAFGATLGVSYEYLFSASAQLRGDEVLGSWRDEETALVDALARISPDLQAIGQLLRPVTRATGPVLGMVDLSRLLDHAIHALPGDALRIAVTAPGGR